MYLIIKRTCDLLFSLIAIVVLLPILLLIIIILLLTGEHTVFYFQTRIGYKNKPFYIWKFATMKKNSAKIGTKTITLPNDDRVFPFGKFLRATKLNELPQIFNILLGQMSFVGPRPTIKIAWDLFPSQYKPILYSLKPGLTGIGSIVFRNEAEILAQYNTDLVNVCKEIIYPYRSRLEQWYYQHRSFYTDFMILFLTAFKILFPKSKLEFKVFKNLPVDSNFTR